MTKEAFDKIAAGLNEALDRVTLPVSEESYEGLTDGSGILHDYNDPKHNPPAEVIPASEETVPATDAEIAKLRKFAKEATIALTGLTAGGSEYFAGKIGDIYVADIPFCVERIRDRQLRDIERTKSAIRALHSEREDANIGRSIISAIGTEVADPTSPLHNWSPAEHYDEVITDLVEMVQATREQAVRESAEIAGTQRGETADGQYTWWEVSNNIRNRILSLSQVSAKT